MYDLENVPPEMRAALSRMTLLDLTALINGQPVRLRKDPNSLLCRQQAAHYLSFSVSYLRQLEAKGKGPKVLRMGPRVLRYRISDLDAWRDAHASKR